MEAALGFEVFDSEEAVAVVIEEDIVVEDGEGVVVGRISIELGTTLLDPTMIGDPDAVRIDVTLLELVAVIELLVLVEVVVGVARLNEFVETDVPLVLEASLTVAGSVLPELVPGAMLVSDAEETALSAVEDVEADLDDD